jgi:hypothetical protein
LSNVGDETIPETIEMPFTAGEERWTVFTSADVRAVEASSSGQSGMLSRFEQIRKIAAASAISFEYF